MSHIYPVKDVIQRLGFSGLELERLRIAAFKFHMRGFCFFITNLIARNDRFRRIDAALAGSGADALLVGDRLIQAFEDVLVLVVFLVDESLNYFYVREFPCFSLERVLPPNALALFKFDFVLVGKYVLFF